MPDRGETGASPLPDPLLSRREAIAALASPVALPLIAACSGDRVRTHTRTSEADALALLDDVADNLLRLSARERDLARHRHRRASGAAIAARAIDPRTGSSESRRRSAADLERVNAFDTHRPLACHAHQRRGRAQRLRHGARRVRAAVRRHHGRRLAQHAVCRHSERRRLSRHPALPRQRSSASRTPPTPRRIWRGCSRMRSSSTASSAACRRRARRGSCRRRS